MNLPRYDYSPNEDFTQYSFYSSGPNGLIQKIIIFKALQKQPFAVFNLGFGDIDENNEINDTVTSNNKDRDMVLATVANTINDFCDEYGNQLIFIQGSNAARTRLYQMSISRHLEEINENFEVKGLTANGWEPFIRHVNYLAFLTNRKY